MSINHLQALRVVSNHETNKYLNKKIEQDIIANKVEREMTGLLRHLETIRNLASEDINGSSAFPISRDQFMEGYINMPTKYQDMKGEVGIMIRDVWQQESKLRHEKWDRFSQELRANKEFLDQIKLNPYNIGFINGIIMGDQIRNRIKEIYTTPVKNGEVDISHLSGGIDYFETHEQQQSELQATKNYILKAEYHDHYPFLDCQSGWYYRDGHNYPSYNYSYEY